MQFNTDSGSQHLSYTRISLAFPFLVQEPTFRSLIGKTYFRDSRFYLRFFSSEVVEGLSLLMIFQMPLCKRKHNFLQMTQVFIFHIQMLTRYTDS